MLCCVVLLSYCIVLLFILLSYIVLCCGVLSYIVLYILVFIMCYVVLCLCYIMLFVVLCCDVFCHVALCHVLLCFFLLHIIKHCCVCWLILIPTYIDTYYYMLTWHSITEHIITYLNTVSMYYNTTRWCITRH